MKVKLDNGRIYMVSREHSDFHGETVDVEHRITTEDAIRLRNELDAAIIAIKPSVKADAIKPCSNCGSIKEADEKHCAECWETK